MYFVPFFGNFLCPRKVVCKLLHCSVIRYSSYGISGILDLNYILFIFQPKGIKFKKGVEVSCLEILLTRR